MKASWLKKTYPEVWDEVYNDMDDDLIMAFQEYEVYSIALHKRIVNNAALFACLAYHKQLKKLKVKK